MSNEEVLKLGEVAHVSVRGAYVIVKPNDKNSVSVEIYDSRGSSPDNLIKKYKKVRRAVVGDSRSGANITLREGDVCYVYKVIYDKLMNMVIILTVSEKIRKLLREAAEEKLKEL